MFWLALVIILSFLVGLRRRIGAGAHVVLVFGLTVLVGAWYLALARAA